MFGVNCKTLTAGLLFHLQLAPFFLTNLYTFDNYYCELAIRVDCISTSHVDNARQPNKSVSPSDINT